MKKMLITMITAGALMVPVGVTLAQNDTNDVTDPVPTCEDQDRVRDQDRAQLRLHDGTGDGTGDCTGVGAGDCTGDHVQDRDRVRLEDGTGDQAQTRLGERAMSMSGRADR